MTPKERRRQKDLESVIQEKVAQRIEELIDDEEEHINVDDIYEEIHNDVYNADDAEDDDEDFIEDDEDIDELEEYEDDEEDTLDIEEAPKKKTKPQKKMTKPKAVSVNRPVPTKYGKSQVGQWAKVAKFPYQKRAQEPKDSKLKGVCRWWTGKGQRRNTIFLKVLALDEDRNEATVRTFSFRKEELSDPLKGRGLVSFVRKFDVDDMKKKYRSTYLEDWQELFSNRMHKLVNL